MKIYVLVFLLFFFSSAYAQTAIDNYKYVILPQKFSFLASNDEYSLNSMAKQLLENKGFTVFFDDAQLPADVALDKCAALKADVQSKGGMFTTSLVLTLKDCRGNIIFEGKPGTSRDKEYNSAYGKALREAFVSLYQVPYTYNGSNGKPDQPIAATVNTPIAATPAPKTTQSAQPDKTLYAQPIPNGYQLIDTSPKKVLTLLKTSVENYFIASNDTVSGIVFKLNQNWVFEYYRDGKLISEELAIKF